MPGAAGSHSSAFIFISCHQIDTKRAPRQNEQWRLTRLVTAGSGRGFDQFWARFEALRLDLLRRNMSFSRSTTRRLQLPLDLDYDSVKPDLIVMYLARRVGMVEKEVGDKHVREAERKIQEYAVSRVISARRD